MINRALQLAVLALLLGAVNIQAGQVRDAIALINNGLSTGISGGVAGEPVIATGIVSRFYQKRNYEPAWKDLSFARSVIVLLGKSKEEGLSPADYHFKALTRLFDCILKNGSDSMSRLAELDVLLTDGVLVYATHLVNGKVAPARFEKTWNYDDVKLLPEEVVSALTLHVDNKTIAHGLERLKPDLDVYRQMKKSLAFYSNLAQRQTFREIKASKVLQLGDTDSVIAALRTRLYLLGFIKEDSGSNSFGKELEQGVERFQKNVQLDPDGVVGPATLNQLNVPFSYRANQIRINMDRIRWVVDDLTPDYLLVNIAGYKLWLKKNDKLVWSTDVMTGAIRTETPMFKSRMTYLVFNPTWTVPRSIVKEMLPKFKSDRTFLVRNNYQLLDRKGKKVDPQGLDWNSFNGRTFPYTLVQMPGENNALGRVKFMFPNSHAIYLHDTPNRHLFKKAQRAFSHGCIRVKDPLRLAELLLDNQQVWNETSILKVVQNKRLKQVKLATPIEVLIMYWTVQPNPEGELEFLPDVYGRDLALIASLKKPLFAK